MRPRFLLFIAILVSVMLALLFWRQQKQAGGLPKSSQQIGQSISTTSGVVLMTAQTLASTTQIIAPAPNQPPRANDRDRTNEIRQAMEAENQPINFYGKVVDQDGNPLPEVSVKGQIIQLKILVPAPWGTEDEIIPVEKTTDSKGCFEVHGFSGRDFGIGSIQKNGYEAEPISHNWKTSAGSIFNPVIFKMWSTNIHEKLITGGNDFEVLPDGKPHVIDLTKGTIAEAGDGDLKVWIRYTNQVTHGQLYDWSAGIEVINGGLLEEPQGAVMYVAPTEGYTNLFQLQKQIKGGQSGEIGDRSFYLILKDGQEYGRMNINLFAPYGKLHPGLIRLSYALNPSGSRILR